MKMRMIFLLLAICPAVSFLQEARSVTDKDLGTGLSPAFLLDTLRGVATELPAGGMGCGLSGFFALDTLRGITGNLASGTSDYFTLDTRSSGTPVFQDLQVGNILVRADSIVESAPGSQLYQVSGSIGLGDVDGNSTFVFCADGDMTVNLADTTITGLDLSGAISLGSGGTTLPLSTLSSNLSINPIDPDNPSTSEMLLTNASITLPNGLSLTVEGRIDLKDGRFNISQGRFTAELSAIGEVKFELFLTDTGLAADIVLNPFQGLEFASFSLGSYLSFLPGIPSLRMSASSCSFLIEKHDLEVLNLFDGAVDLSLDFGIPASGSLRFESCGSTWNLIGNDIEISFRFKSMVGGKSNQFQDEYAQKEDKGSPKAIPLITGVKIGVGHAEIHIPKSGPITGTSAIIQDLSLSLELALAFNVEVAAVNASLQWPNFVFDTSVYAKFGSLFQAHGIKTGSYLNFETGELMLWLKGDTGVEILDSNIAPVVAGLEMQAYVDLARDVPMIKMIGLGAGTNLSLFGHDVASLDGILTLHTSGDLYSCEPFTGLNSYPISHTVPTSPGVDFLDWNKNGAWNSGLNVELFSNLLSLKSEFIFDSLPIQLRGKAVGGFCFKGFGFSAGMPFSIDLKGGVAWGAYAHWGCSGNKDTEQTKFVTILGDLEGQVSLLVTDMDTPPSIVFGPIISYLSPTSAVVEWETDEPCNGIVDYGLVPQSDKSTVDWTYSTSHSINLANLTPNSDYMCVVVSTDLTNNPPVISEILEFTTPSQADSTPPTFISSPSVIVLGTDTIQISWETNEPTIGIVDYGLTIGYSNTLIVDEFARKSLVTISGLQPGSTYHYRIGVEDLGGFGPISTDDLTFVLSSTVDQTPPTITSGPQVERISATSARLSWETNEPSDSVVEYGSNTEYGNQSATSGFGKEHEIVLRKLMDGSTYHIRIAATDPFGNGPTYSEDLVISLTLEPTPTPTEPAAEVHHWGFY